MKINADAVIGAGYGDEGKGLMTDFFCKSNADKRIINIKFNGGAQAGHTVSEIDINTHSFKRKVFSQIGSGSFNKGVETYLSKRFLINFIYLGEEIANFISEFSMSPVINIDTRCSVALPVDIELNDLVESIRAHKHGTCGFGIFETWNRNKYGSTQFKVSDLQKLFSTKSGNIALTDEFESTLSKINEISKNYIKLRQSVFSQEMNDDAAWYFEGLLSKIQTKNAEYLIKTYNFIQNYDNLNFVHSINELLTDDTHLVFEGAQGLELSMNTIENMPHCTPSDTGVGNVMEVLNEITNAEVSTNFCFVTRTYKTKHGAGEFKEYDKNVKKCYALYDNTNVENAAQGVIMYGLLDTKRLFKIIGREIEKVKALKTWTYEFSLSITHADQTNSVIPNRNKLETVDTVIEDSKSIIGTKKHYVSYGPQAENIFIK